MKFDRTNPCSNCPFRKSDKAVRVTTGRVREITTSDAIFPCHKTVDYSHDDEGRTTKDSSACAGSIIHQMKTHRPNLALRLAICLRLVDINKYDTPGQYAKVIDKPDEMAFQRKESK